MDRRDAADNGRTHRSSLWTSRTRRDRRSLRRTGRDGTVEFLLGDSVTTLHANDVVCVPPGTRHGYLNRSGLDVEMLVMFCPAGFEELFVRYRTDQPSARGDGFIADALRLFATKFET